MKNKLFVHYDEDGDLLEIRIGEPTESYYNDLGNDVFERRDEKTDELSGLAIFNFKKRAENGIDVELPVKLLA